MKKGLIILFIFIISIFIFWYGKKDKEIESSKDIAFYYENDTGSYEQSTDSKWNSGDYALNVQNSICNGEKNPAFLSWNDENNSIILKRNKSTNCTLYFDKKRKFTLLSNYPIEGSERELTNILGKDGDFEDANAWKGYLSSSGSTTNHIQCELSSDITKHGEKSCKIPGNTQYLENVTVSTKSYYIQKNHKYYVEFSSYNESSLSVNIEFWWPIDGTNKGVYFGYDNRDYNSWKTYSYLGENLNAETQSYKLRLDNNNTRREIDLYFDELMMIDLTESYGDSIPSKEELDNTIMYFDDSVYMKSVMGLQGEFKVTGVSDNQEVECNNGGEAKVSNGVVTITGNSPYITCYLK